MGVEGVQGTGAGAAPPVDRLVGVSDGGDAASGEQCGQEPGLCHGGVLELIEENGGVLGPHGGGGPGDFLGNATGQGDLLAEVEQTAAPLVGTVFLDNLQHASPLAHDLGGLADQGFAAGHLLEAGEEPGKVLQVLSRLLDAQEVVGQGAVQHQSSGDGGGKGLQGQGAGAHFNKGGDDLPGAGFGNESGVGVDANEQTMVAHKTPSEGVVGGDGGLGGVVIEFNESGARQAG